MIPPFFFVCILPLLSFVSPMYTDKLTIFKREREHIQYSGVNWCVCVCKMASVTPSIIHADMQHILYWGTRIENVENWASIKSATHPSEGTCFDE